MLDIKGVLLATLVVVFLAFIAYWWRRFSAHPAAGTATPEMLGIGAVTNFFDTLGIGSYATTTSLFRLRGLVPDELIPGTLNVGHVPPTVVQALIYISLVNVDPITLVALIGAAVLGAWLGAGIVSRWPRRQIQIGMGLALIGAAAFMFLKAMGIAPSGTPAIGLEGTRLAIGMAGNFVLGALMTLGIGLYAPCLVMIGLLGMVEKTAFPIMMGSCAFLMPVAGTRFIDRGRYSPRAALGLSLGGVPAVLVAAYVVGSLPLEYVRWLVIVVVLYTATTMLRAAFRRAAA